MSWQWFIVGVFIGGGVGLIVSALCHAARNEDKPIFEVKEVKATQMQQSRKKKVYECPYYNTEMCPSPECLLGECGMGFVKWAKNDSSVCRIIVDLDKTNDAAMRKSMAELRLAGEQEGEDR